MGPTKAHRLGDRLQFQHPRVAGISRDNPNVVLYLAPKWLWCPAGSLTYSACQSTRHDPPNGLGPVAAGFFVKTSKREAESFVVYLSSGGFGNRPLLGTLS
jgi:hypothetical protein